MRGFLFLATLATEAFAIVRRAPIPTEKTDDLFAIQEGTFSQLIDHNNPDLGTFQQSYWYNQPWYNGTGSPIVLFSPNHSNGTGMLGFLFNGTTMGRITQELGGAGIVLEHRYWGNSTPFNELTTENLKYHTVENALQDIIYFANHVELPFAPNGTNPKDVPWVLFGGSYAGGITGWIANLYPGTFWAYYSTSGLMQAIESYWQYFVRIEAGMPKNCSKDVAGVVEYMDDVLLHGSEQNVTDLKGHFGLEAVPHNDDFMAALGVAPGMWQLGDIRDNHLFYTWCDYIENVNVTKSPAGPEGVGVQAAFQGYARWWKEVGLTFFRGLSGCSSSQSDIDCIDTHNASSVVSTDVSMADQTGRAYMWLLCSSPLGFWQTGAPAGQTSLVSRLLTVEYFERSCGLFFPPGPNGETYNPTGRTVDDFNAFTGGWNPQNLSRVLFVNGEFDPWTSSSVSSSFRPGGPLQSSEKVTVLITPGAHHVTDAYTVNGEGPGNEKVKATIDAAVAQIVKWVGEWPGSQR